MTSLENEIFSCCELEKVDFSSNDCIDEHFEGSTKIAALQQTVNEKCGFEEPLTIKLSLALFVIFSRPSLMTFYISVFIWLFLINFHYLQRKFKNRPACSHVSRIFYCSLKQTFKFLIYYRCLVIVT